MKVVSSHHPGTVFVISGPSGAGKSSILKALIEGAGTMAFSISHTTRKPRAAEADGRDYHFITEDAFKKLREAGGFVEWAQVHEHLYGTSHAELERIQAQGKDAVLEIDVQGALQIKKKLPDSVAVMILPPSWEELDRRLDGRKSEDARQKSLRLQRAYQEIGYCEHYDYLVVNREFEATVQALSDIASLERLKRELQARERAVQALTQVNEAPEVLEHLKETVPRS